MNKLNLFLILQIFAVLFVYSEDLKPINLEKGEVIYTESFDGVEKQSDKWVIRQHTVWSVENGVFKGLPSSKETQEKLIKSGHKSHLGLNPKIMLNHGSQSYIASFRFMFDDKKEGTRNFTFGHHISKILFTEDGATLRSKSKSEAPRAQLKNFKLEAFKWYEILVEVEKEHLSIQIKQPNGELVKLRGHFPEYKKSKKRNLELTGNIDGMVQVDDIKIWKSKGE